MSPKIALVDLENTPGLGYFWGSTWKTDILKVVEPSRVMCWAGKWLGDRTVHYYSTFHDGRELMLERAWEMLDEADAVVTYNGKHHDTPHFNTEFVRAGMGLPSPYRQTDLYRVVKGTLNLHSNRLNSVLHEFNLGSKVTHEGLPLWLKCMAGDEKAWRRMRRYNIGDVVELEKVYRLLQPVIPQSMAVNHTLYCDGDVCPRCGSAKLQRRGKSATSLGLYPRFFCTSCRGWSQSGKSIERADLRGAA